VLQACLLGVFIHGAAKWGFASMWCGPHPAGVGRQCCRNSAVLCGPVPYCVRYWCTVGRGCRRLVHGSATTVR
jgi:hypothetical protein